MSLLRAFFELEGNRIVLNFAHALVFFLLGFSVLLKTKRWSELTLAKSLPWLGLFGILNGIGDWGLVFIPVQTYVLSDRVINVLWFLDTSLLAISYAFLLYCGLHLLAQTRPTLAWVPKLAIFAYILWFIIYLAFWLSGQEHFEDGRATTVYFEIVYRYVFAFAGSLVTAWALSLQRKELERLDLNVSIPPLQWVGYSFVLHAIAAGLIVPEASFFPANIINDRALFELTGIPVRLFTGVSGAIVAVSMLVSLEVFDTEFERRLDKARKFHTVMQERTRIARDLHDGIIQMLYGVGLGLEGVALSLESPTDGAKDDSNMSKAELPMADASKPERPTVDASKPERSTADAPMNDDEMEFTADKRMRIHAEIAGIMQLLDRAIRDVRRYIMQLKVPTEEHSLDEHLHIFTREIQKEMRVPIRVKTDPIDLGVIPPEAVMDLLLIVREAVSNASRHAKASEIKVALVKDRQGISLSISDDGIGFNPENVQESVEGQHLGLENMHRRAASIGGRLSIHSDIGHGTEILLRIPLYSQ